ncbi:hypothetical protein OAF98_04070 [Planctomicrobium sp.]|jgi:hypothetical protein|nr:hypothetical protein [Planctomicrobium sp.]MBT5019205.1 hypothetical protein [Planctomicrobium sp.]MDB4743640.1 hypothetical protein [Planctomicrobium sp.]
MSSLKSRVRDTDCPSCRKKDALKTQTFCAECGYFPATSERIDNTEEKLSRDPSLIGTVVVALGILLLGIAGLLSRVYIWDTGEHHYWMRYLLIIGGAAFALGHLAAFWYSLVKNGIDLSDVIFGPKSVWGPVFFDIHKKWLVAAIGTYGVTILLVGGVLFGVNYESYLSSSSNKSLWKMISDIQVALGKEATEMPEISFKKVQGNLNIPTGGDGKLVLDGDLSAINPENLTILAETLGGSGKTSNSSGDKSSFTDLADSTDISALIENGTQGEANGESLVSLTSQSKSSNGTPTGPQLHTKTLKRNQLECFIFGFTTNEAGELDELVMGSVVEGKPVYVGLLPSAKIGAEHLKGVSLDFFKKNVSEPIVECRLEATWLEPTVICVLEHQGKNRKGTYLLNRFVGFREFL